MTNQDSILKSRHHLANKGLNSQSHDLSNNHVWMWELYHKEDWVSKNWFFWIAVLDKTLESPLDCKEIKPVDLKENQSWIFIGRTDAEAETRILSHLMWSTDSLEKTLKAGGEGDDRGWDSWMASPTQWIWDWANPGRWWRSGKPDVLQSMGSQRVGHDWVTEQQQSIKSTDIEW